MAGLEYQHIGHDPSLDQIAIWSMDERGQLHEERAAKHASSVEWLTWSHEKVFSQVNMKALGRVEIHRKAGSIHISDPDVVLSSHRFSRLLNKLDEKYPDTRWFLFGGGFKGESVMAALAQRVLG